MRMCSACEDGEHHACGMQTWCECDCDPEFCECFACAGPANQEEFPEPLDQGDEITVEEETK